MARRYAVGGQDTNTAGTTMLGITATTAVRPAIYDLLVGSVATAADNAAEYFLQRYTAAGTSTGVTPQALDSGDPAATATAGVNHSVEPTYTASAVLLRVAKNQRATFRWVARERGELVLPATAANGIGILANAIGGSAVTEDFQIHYEE